MIQKTSKSPEKSIKSNFLKERMDLLSAYDKRHAIEEIMHDFKVTRNTVYRWLRLENKDLPIVLKNYGKPDKTNKSVYFDKI
jgi:hypothetical protein